MNGRICFAYYSEYEWAKQSWADVGLLDGMSLDCVSVRGVPFLHDARNELITDRFGCPGRPGTGSKNPIPRDWFLLQDSDVRAWGGQSLLQLLNHDVDIVGAKYKMHNSEHCYAWKDGRTLPWSTRGFQEVDQVGTGLMLVRARVFQAIPYPWFFNPAVNGEVIADDQNFCNLARAAGFHVYLDGNLEVEHKPKERG